MNKMRTRWRTHAENRCAAERDEEEEKKSPTNELLCSTHKPHGVIMVIVCLANITRAQQL